MTRSFIDFLNEELRRKQNNNRAYSMRSFAKYLGIDSGSLSAILNRKIPLTMKRFEKLASHFDLSNQQTEFFREEVLQLSNSPVAFKMLDEDEVIALSKSYYSVILHLFDLKIFENDINWIAKAVGIDVEECLEALERLERLKLICREENGDYVKSVNNVSLLKGRTSESKDALKSLMRDYFNKTLESIDKVADEDRLHSGTVFSIKKSDLPEIVEQLRNIRAKILNSQNKGGEKDEVYLLSIAMTPMTNLG